jgi:hypothetical protein
MLSMEDIEQGTFVTHRNTALRYSVVDAGDDEVLLSPESDDMQDLVVPVKLFREEFVLTDRFSMGRARAADGDACAARRRPSPAGPR